jgi:ubiquinone/menaquinone biosynthesis C-methylase UbiE
MPSRPLLSGRIYQLAFTLGLLPVLAGALSEYDAEAARLSELMNWKPAQVIAEIGAGEGQMSFFAASRIGRAGHVYTTELDDSKLAYLKKQVDKLDLQNVTVIKADPVSTNLPVACCNGVFMRHVYHHFKDPAQTDASIFRALKPGGLLAIIDFNPRKGLPPVEEAPKTHGNGHGVSENIVIGELKAAGFEIVSTPDDWPNHEDYCIIARKPATPQ